MNELDQLRENVIKPLEDRVHYLEELVDTYLHSPWYRRLWFYIDGWPADRIASQRKKRWWHR